MDTDIMPPFDDLGFNHQRCTFHTMKNLMDKLIKKHNGLNREIKALNNDIKELKKLKR